MANYFTQKEAERTRRPNGSVVAAVLLALGCATAACSSQPARTPGAGSGSKGEAQAKVERKDFVRTLRVHGTVEAVTSYTVTTPRLRGPGLNALTVTHITPTGTRVSKGDILAEFDRQDQERNAVDRKAEYLDLEEQIKKKKAEQETAKAADETALKQGENAVGTAELEMRKNEVISKIDAEKNRQNLEEARAKLEQLRKTFELKRKAARAELRILEIQRDRAKDAMEYAEENAKTMQVRSPLDGVVMVNQIWKGGTRAEVQEGDQIRAGTAMMQVVNPETMQVRAKINQADISDLAIGHKVQIRLDAYPKMKFAGRLENIGAIGTTSGLSDKVRTFVATFSMEGNDPKLVPDLSASVDVEIERMEGVLVAPRDAVVREGEQYYLLEAGGKKRAVKIRARSDDEVVIESGAEAGTVVLRASNETAGPP